jgi:hypothetical protein
MSIDLHTGSFISASLDATKHVDVLLILHLQAAAAQPSAVPVYPPVRVVEETVYGPDDDDDTQQHSQLDTTAADTAVGLAAWNPQKGALVHVNSSNEVCYRC